MCRFDVGWGVVVLLFRPPLQWRETGESQSLSFFIPHCYTALDFVPLWSDNNKQRH